MKVPDKIYCGNNGHGNLSYSREKVYPSMDEYIRKDALLEWARNNGSTLGTEQLQTKSVHPLMKK